MSSPASTSSACVHKITKNMAGLSLDLSPETLSSESFEEFPITACSPSTPSLEFDWSSDDSLEVSNDSEAQYVYIPYDSPFYRPTTPCSSAYIALGNFPFTCDALREDGSLFSNSPYFIFRDNAECEEDSEIEIVDWVTEASEDPQRTVEWIPRELDDDCCFYGQPKSPVPDDG